METTSYSLLKTSKYNFFDYYIYIMIATSSFLVFQVRRQELLMVLQAGFCIIMFFYYKKIYFIKNALLNIVFICMVLTCASAVFNNVRSGYTRTAIYWTIVAIPVYFAVAYLGKYLKDHPSKWEVIRNAIKLMCLVQMVWCLIQFLAYKGAGLDLNQLLFVDKLHTIETASFYKDNVFMPSGLCWHPIIMAPILVLAYFLFDNLFIKVFCLVEALFIGNSTVLIIVALCVFLDIVHWIYKMIKTGKTKGWIALGIVILFVLFILVLVFTDYWDKVWEKITYVLERISGAETDLSTLAHKRYYTAYGKVFDMSSLSQIFFGYGSECSGYPYTVLFGQYALHKSWCVETDIMNMLVSRGIVGFIAFYASLIQIIVKGRKISYKYILFTIAIILGGITYNIQFNWLVFIEMLMIVALDNRLNFFESSKEKKKRVLW